MGSLESPLIEDGPSAARLRRPPKPPKAEIPAFVTTEVISEEEQEEVTAMKSYESRWNHDMTFDGRLFLSRLRRNPDYVCVGFEVFGLILCIVALYFCYFHFELMHYHVTSVYAGLGHPHAQHLMGDKLLHGKGVDKDENLAMEWFKKAADQGHPHSAYNLAIGHLNGLKAGLEPGEAHRLIGIAAKGGVKLAQDVLENVCKHGRCE